MKGWMQHWPLLMHKIIDHAGGHFQTGKSSGAPSKGQSSEPPIARSASGRAKSPSASRDGVKPGDRVATLAWNTVRHMEAWYGIMGIGAVCHTLNPRLFPDQLCYIINHAEDQVLLTDLTFLPPARAPGRRLPSVQRYRRPDRRGAHAGDPARRRALLTRSWIGEVDADCAWGGFDENTAAGLCYTSGTTGNPKGVLYSHRSNFLHPLTLQHGVMGSRSGPSDGPAGGADVPRQRLGPGASAPGGGRKMVMPGQKLDGASIHELLESEGVTFSAAVPTVWQCCCSTCARTASV